MDYIVSFSFVCQTFIDIHVQVLSVHPLSSYSVFILSSFLKQVLALQNITHILTETNAQTDKLILQLSSNVTALQFEGKDTIL